MNAARKIQARRGLNFCVLNMAFVCEWASVNRIGLHVIINDDFLESEGVKCNASTSWP